LFTKCHEKSGKKEVILSWKSLENHSQISVRILFNVFLLFSFITQQRCCSDGGYILIFTSPRSYPTDEVGLAAGGQSARCAW